MLLTSKLRGFYRRLVRNLRKIDLRLKTGIRFVECALSIAITSNCIELARDPKDTTLKPHSRDEISDQEPS